MQTGEIPFDPAHYGTQEEQIGLLADALISNDVAFVVAALKTVLRAQGLDGNGLGLDPRLSVVLAAFETLGFDLLPAARAPQP